MRRKQLVGLFSAYGTARSKAQPGRFRQQPPRCDIDRLWKIEHRSCRPASPSRLCLTSTLDEHDLRPMGAILTAFVIAQLVAPVLLIRRYRWVGILAAFGFTALLHYAFHMVCVARDAEAASAYGAAPFTFVVLALSLVYCIIAISIAGAFEARAERKRIHETEKSV